MSWLPFHRRRKPGGEAAAGSAKADPRAARLRQRRAGGRREVDRSLRAALLAVLDEDDERAQKLIARAVEIDSDAVDAYLALARLYRTRGELGRSIRIHQNLLLRPDLDADERNAALLQLARDFHQGGFSERAVASYEEVLEHDRRNRVALEGLRDLALKAGDYPRAIELGKRLAKLVGAPARDQSQLLLQMAQGEHDEGRSDAARKILKKLRRRDPENAEASALLGEIEAERGKDKAALAAWSDAARRGGEVAARVHPKLEATFAALGRAQEYESFLRDVLSKREDDVPTRVALARTLASRGEIDSAVSELRKLLDRDPTHLQARVALGRLLLAEHRETDAVKEYGELLTVLEDDNDGAPPEPPE